jgi:hypothetical protein
MPPHPRLSARAARLAGVTFVVNGANSEVPTMLRTIRLDRLLCYTESP